MLMKLVVVGGVEVGKTSLVHHFVQGKPLLDTYHQTIALDYSPKTISVAKKRVKLQIWDLSGALRFRDVVLPYLRNADIVLLVCDMTNPDSLHFFDSWLEEIVIESARDVLVHLVVNKCDAKTSRQPGGKMLSQDDVSTFVQQHSALIRGFSMSSAKTGQGVRALFEEIAQDLLLSRMPKAADTARCLCL